jgi:hypothetical protein
MKKTRTVRLTYKEWKTLREFFRYEETIIRNSFGEPGNLEGTFRKNYEESEPDAWALYERARKVFGDGP